MIHLLSTRYKHLSGEIPLIAPTVQLSAESWSTSVAPSESSQGWDLDYKPSKAKSSSSEGVGGNLVPNFEFRKKGTTMFDLEAWPLCWVSLPESLDGFKRPSAVVAQEDGTFAQRMIAAFTTSFPRRASSSEC